MPKKKKEEEKKEAPVSEPAEPAPENFKTNLNDPVAVKHCLDEQFTSWMKDDGFVEDTRANNIKLALGFTAVGMAALAQFYPVPFPESRLALGILVLMYMVITCYLTFQDWCIGNCIFLATREGWPRLRVNTSFFRWEREYEVFLADRDNLSDELSYKLDCTDYFDVKGHFLKERFAKELTRIIASFHKGEGERVNDPDKQKSD
eukprot:g22987.t1